MFWIYRVTAGCARIRSQRVKGKQHPKEDFHFVFIVDAAPIEFL
ncbi:hypothetical protein ACVWYG_003307 [Pedobacter sp. UYEF25]